MARRRKGGPVKNFFETVLGGAIIGTVASGLNPIGGVAGAVFGGFLWNKVRKNAEKEVQRNYHATYGTQKGEQRYSLHKAHRTNRRVRRGLGLSN